MCRCGSRRRRRGALAKTRCTIREPGLLGSTTTYSSCVHASCLKKFPQMICVTYACPSPATPEAVPFFPLKRLIRLVWEDWFIAACLVACLPVATDFRTRRQQAAVLLSGLEAKSGCPENDMRGILSCDEHSSLQYFLPSSSPQV